MFRRNPFTSKDSLNVNKLTGGERQNLSPMSVSPMGRSLSPSPSPIGNIRGRGGKMDPIHVGSVNMKEEFIICKIKQIVDENDPTLALTIAIPDVPNETARYFDVDDLKTQLLGFTHDFPGKINLCCNQLSGYTTKDNMATHIVASAGVNLLAVTETGGLSSHNVLYGLSSMQPVWDVSGIGSLTFFLTMDVDPLAEKIQLPLAQPIWLTAKIVRVIV